jgi:hypothetical protein
MLDTQFTPINWHKIIKTTKWACILTLALYVGLESSAAIDADADRVMAYRKINSMIHDLAAYVIDFARPYVEIILMILLIYWAKQRFNITFDIPPVGDWKIVNMIMIIVIGGFVFAALRGYSGVTYLHDLALVVLGFYFGRSAVGKMHEG